MRRRLAAAEDSGVAGEGAAGDEGETGGRAVDDGGEHRRVVVGRVGLRGRGRAGQGDYVGRGGGDGAAGDGGGGVVVVLTSEEGDIAGGGEGEEGEEEEERVAHGGGFPLLDLFLFIFRSGMWLPLLSISSQGMDEAGEGIFMREETTGCGSAVATGQTSDYCRIGIEAEAGSAWTA